MKLELYLIVVEVDDLVTERGRQPLLMLDAPGDVLQPLTQVFALRSLLIASATLAVATLGATGLARVEGRVFPDDRFAPLGRV